MKMNLIANCVSLKRKIQHYLRQSKNLSNKVLMS